MKHVLAVIPARGGSKGIPRKNVRLMNGKPLIYYAIKNALECNLITDVVVTSDDEEIKRIARIYGAEIIDRDLELARDNVTLDPVIYDAVLQMERKKDIIYDAVVTMQPTSPLLKAGTLVKALEEFLGSEQDSYISGTNKPHLSWTKKEGKYIPLYEKRLNRQQLPPNYLEAGAFVISKRACVTADSRLGSRISVYEIPSSEAVDIDSVNDWILCETALAKKRIVFRVDGYSLIGMGHVYRCISLAQYLIGHDLIFVMNKAHEEGIRKISNMFLPLKEIDSEDEFYQFIKEFQADIVVLDVLDTAEKYVKKLKEKVARVVTIEDMGPGSRHADAVVNALYYNSEHVRNYYFGERYICLRDEFMILQDIKKSKSEKVQNELSLIVLFGGADPSNLTKRVYELARMHANKKINGHHIRYTFIAGPAYSCEEHGIHSIPEYRIEVMSDVKRLSDIMVQSDLAITSQGRTVYELAAVGVPAIVLAQNEREQLHEFAQMENGFLNLGLGANVSDETIWETIEWLCKTPEIRLQMVRLQKQHDLLGGIKRVRNIILGENEVFEGGDH